LEKKINTWQKILAESFTSVEQVCDYLKIDIGQLQILSDYKDFPFKVPRQFVELMEPGNPDDPLLKQVLPLNVELVEHPGYSLDPVGDLNSIAEVGVIHKYHGRALWILTGACAINCRYCFRRHFPYNELQLSAQKIQGAVKYITDHNEITELILSGGDPLLLSDHKFADILALLKNIPHLKRLRIHSRVPVVLPSRINSELLGNLNALNKQIIMVLHVNHSRELSQDVKTACSRMLEKHITLLNQSVLLKAVNDDGELLCGLSEKLFEFGILPYIYICWIKRKV
jgi:EF-P beta-lysylation protein EpmB